MSRRDEQMQRVQEFLKTIDTVKESGIIFSSSILRRDIIKAIRDYFGTRKVATLDESIGIKEKIDEIIIQSLREGTPLFVSVSVQEIPIIARRLEQLFEDGYIEEATSGGRKKITPANGWYSIVWADAASFRDQEFPLKELYGYKLSL